MTRLRDKIYHASPAQAVALVRKIAKRFGRAEPRGPATRFNEVDVAFLRSEHYRKLMGQHLPHPGVYDHHEAQNDTRNFRFRHHEANDQLGLFRWRGIQEHLDVVLNTVTDNTARVVDFGGGACPLGLGSIIVDQLDVDGYGIGIRYHNLHELDFTPTVIFSSHTFEHIEPLDDVLAQLRDTLAEGGRLLAHLPAYTCERWRAGVHSNSLYNDHVWTFGLRGTTPPPGLPRYVEIDTKIEQFFEVEKAVYCGDDSIFLCALRK